ncbi:MAG: 3' terminal RNA ribose 2'-O-methyltransferase Hen1 [Streptosporangiaceae bacterium]
MLITISTTLRPATDLGFLLYKHPARAQAFEVSVGTAHVFFPAASAERCTAALLLEVDPVDVVRGRKGPASEGFSLGQYVNDRPYAASSMMAVALARVLKSAMAGRCDARPELAARPVPLELHVPALPCRGGPELARRLFGPLGWQVHATPIPLDEHFPGWGESRYVGLTLRGEQRLAAALNQLYVLLPVLDDAKHYWVNPDEVGKLIRAGAGWLAGHPEREMITRRYLAHQRDLVESAVARLAESDDAEPEALDGAAGPEAGDEPDRAVPLAAERRRAVLAALRSLGARRVADLGCGEGSLLAELLADPAFTGITGTDVSARALSVAARRLRADRLPEPQRLTLFQSSLTYRDARLTGFDAAVLMEVIEHVDPARLAAVARTVFGEAAPAAVVMTTPNVEYNVRFGDLPAGAFRHRDHRFEWTRGEFRSWAAQTAAGYGYQVRVLPVGADDPDVGPPAQMAVFTRAVPGGAADAPGEPGAASAAGGPGAGRGAA